MVRLAQRYTRKMWSQQVRHRRLSDKLRRGVNQDESVNLGDDDKQSCLGEKVTTTIALD